VDDQLQKIKERETIRKRRKQMVENNEQLDEIDEKILEAKEAGMYMVAVWIVKDGAINYKRMMKNFPLSDSDKALKQVVEDLEGVGKTTAGGMKG